MRRLTPRLIQLSTAATLLALTGCGPTAGSGDDGGGGGDQVDADPASPDAGLFTPPPDGAQCQKMDVLFVIDNSGSMAQEQTNLAANFPGFISVLDASGLDYRVAVTTSGRDYSYTMTTPIGPLPESQDGGDNGRMLQPASCGMSRRWIEKTDPDPAGTFACVAAVGTGGPSDEMPLAATRDAFEDRISDGHNAGFRRADALLAIVILTDENDCSYEQSVSLPFGQFLCESMMEPVSNYVAFLDGYTGSRQRWATAVIAGAGPGDCTSALGDADEATRLIDFVNQTGPNAVISSICEGDLSVGLAAALDTFSSACATFPPIE